MNGNSDRVPVVVEAMLRRCRERLLAVMDTRPATHIERARRAERLAVLCERQARLWRLLNDWLITRDDMSPVFSLAATEAEGAQRENAGFWRDSAADWRELAAGEPMCGVVGCGCGGVCGVPA